MYRRIIELFYKKTPQKNKQLITMPCPHIHIECMAFPIVPGHFPNLKTSSPTRRIAARFLCPLVKMTNQHAPLNANNGVVFHRFRIRIKKTNFFPNINLKNTIIKFMHKYYVEKNKKNDSIKIAKE